MSTILKVPLRQPRLLAYWWALLSTAHAKSFSTLNYDSFYRERKLVLVHEHRCIHTHQKIEIQFRRQYWKQFQPGSNLVRAEIAQKNDWRWFYCLFSSFSTTGSVDRECARKLALNSSSCYLSLSRGWKLFQQSHQTKCHAAKFKN